jgi:hypothetical protein
MKSYDYDAVVYDSEIFCTECLPDGVSRRDDDVTPIFADSEWDYVPICCQCSYEHDYVSVLNYD